jgi:hypothetical protein
MIKLKQLLNEGFDLPPDIDNRAELLSKFIVSLFLSDFEDKLSDMSRMGAGDIIKYNEYYRLTALYKKETEGMFSIKKEGVETKWGISSMTVVCNDGVLPNTVIVMGVGYNKNVDGEAPHEHDNVDGEDILVINHIRILIDSQKFKNNFKESITDLDDLVKHELRHWMQFKDVIGLSKVGLLNKQDGIFGGLQNVHGYETRDNHYMRDIEFKPNVHTYAYNIKKSLNKNSSRSDWERDFKNIVTGKGLDRFGDIRDYINNLKNMKKKDLMRWKQFVKEVYSLIFN